MFKKVQYHDNVIHQQFSSKDRVCLQLLRPDSLEEIRKKRRILHFYEKVVNKDNVTSLEEAYH